MSKNLLLLLILFIGQKSTGQQPSSKYTLEGLDDEVEILTDHWGIPHIYANNEKDLFFAQGFYAAKDRLFQFEMWRRQATGTLSEIFGPTELKRDIGARLFQFRGDIVDEMNHYHERGSLIITSFVDGINAYVRYVNDNPEALPLELKLLGITPKEWTPKDVISRHQGLLGNIGQELSTARAVSKIGENMVKQLAWFHPKEPDLTIDPSIDQSLLFEDILELYNAFRKPIDFTPDYLATGFRGSWDKYRDLAAIEKENSEWASRNDINDYGSNNWVIHGSRTESGFPIMANDPHRTQAVPSLRYMCHLVAPGWNVIGGGEPTIPGISIGHNEYGAWGLTVFRTDAEDLYVYELNPDNPEQYKYGESWENMKVIEDTIHIKGQNPEIVKHRYTRHGPVVKIIRDKNTAYAVRCGWLEIGGSPYLASLRMDQAENWEEFRDACNYSNIPGENMVWADKNGNIGWQAVGIAPLRRNWSGLVPVPGNGQFEWDGYLPIFEKPNSFNPEVGYINTSNENVTPLTYDHWDAIGFTWTDPYRGDRVAEVLENGQKHNLSSNAELQTDYLSLPARQIMPLLKNLKPENKNTQDALDILLEWDLKMSPNSIGAGIYNKLEREIRIAVAMLKVPEVARPYLSLQLKRVIDFLMLPDSSFGDNPLAGRNELLLNALDRTVEALTQQLGAEFSKWMYGQPKYKHMHLHHPLSKAVTPEIREKLDVGPAGRGGNSYTVNNTSGADNQRSGASFKIICDVADWDYCLATNNPGQNGDPEHPHYSNLFETWSNDQYFPLFYTRPKVESVMAESWKLRPD